METIFLHYLTDLEWWVYALIFVGMFVEGDAILFAAFYLARSGYFNAWLLILISVVGVILGDLIWYKLGEQLEKRSPFFRKIAARITKPLDRRLNKRPISTIFITKFIYGIHHATLMRAGATRVSFKKYFMIVSFAGISWIGIIGGLAYFSSLSFDLLKKHVRYGEIGLLIGIIIFFIISHLLSRMTKKEIEE